MILVNIKKLTIERQLSIFLWAHLFKLFWQQMVIVNFLFWKRLSLPVYNLELIRWNMVADVGYRLIFLHWSPNLFNLIKSVFQLMSFCWFPKLTKCSFRTDNFWRINLFILLVLLNFLNFFFLYLLKVAYSFLLSLFLRLPLIKNTQLLIQLLIFLQYCLEILFQIKPSPVFSCLKLL